MNALRALHATLDRHALDVASLLLRLTLPVLMVMNHGWGKLMNWPAKHATFSDPLGVSSPVSMALAIFGELVCPLLLIVGLGVRTAAVPSAITMAVAALLVHKGDVLGDGEHALVFCAGFCALVVLGGGRFSLDAVLARRRSR